MKNILSLICLLSMFFVSSAQITYTGKVMSNNVGIDGATLIAVGGSGNTITEPDGTFEITLEQTNKVNVQYIGFLAKKVTLSSSQSNIIILEAAYDSLAEVVVSASRELQERKEVPHAISVIDSKKIQETKAFGFDQLLNDTPGVYFSSSRASGNEQHFTAARSPISTRPLFLFLEDGLPTRPTAIFNHNTLLERNQAAYDRIEVLRGPAASIYGSDAIGGSFNFITKNPEDRLKGAFDLQSNTLGFTGANLDFGKNINKYVGFYLASQFNQRVRGPFEHSDYSKKALTAKLILTPTEFTKFTLMYNNVDFFTDMAGSIGEEDFNARNFESDQTFTNRDAESSRVRLVWDQNWNSNNKTSVSAIYRENTMIQNPSFRIRQNRDMGRLTGTGSGELNNNTFESYFGNIQHQLKLDALDSKFIIGLTADLTNQDFVAETTSVVVNPETGDNLSFNVNEGDFNLNYEATILNYASYLQYQFTPLEKLNVTLGARYDLYFYDFENRKTDDNALSDALDSWDNLSPKIGLNYNFSNTVGVYANYSQGFTPPQASTLYRNRDENIGLEPSTFHNYEVGTYLKLARKLKLDFTLYQLDGRNTLVSVRTGSADEVNEAFLSTNAGKTSSYGIEYGLSYKPIPQIEISHNGTYARHRYERFTAILQRPNPRRGLEGEFGDFSDTDRETVPNLIGTSKIRFSSKNGLSLAFEHELIGRYNTSFEGAVRDDNGERNLTETYSGHNVFNFLVNYRYKRVEVWMHLFNVFDKLYANRVSYNLNSNRNTFTVGNPRAFHFGARYNF